MDYQSNVEDVNEVTKKVTVTIPGSVVAKEFDSAMQEVARNAAIKGFRPGKAPVHLVRQLHGGRVKFEVANRLISTCLGKIVQDEKIEMIGSPEVDFSGFEEGKEFSFTANLSLMPRPTISNYDKFKVEAAKHEITDKEVDQVLERMRESKGKLKKNEFRTTAKTGDVVGGDLVITLEGEAANRPEPIVVELGSGTLPKELDEAIVGMEIGTSKTVSITLPADHRNQKLAGKPANYQFTLNEISEKDLPALDDAFAASLGLETETLLALRIKIREQLESQAKSEEKAEIHAAVLEQVVERNQFLVPQFIIDEEIRDLLVRNRAIDPQKTKPEDIDVTPFRASLGEIALKRVRTAIAVDRICDQENVIAADEEVHAQMELLSKEHNIPVAEVQKYFAEGQRVDSLKGEVRRNKVLDLLRSRATVTEKKEKAAKAA